MTQLRLWTANNRIYGTSENPIILEKLQGIPGSFLNSKKNIVSWPASPFVAAAHVESFQGYDVIFDDAWMELWQQYLKIGESNRFKFEMQIEEHKSRTPSWLHQRQAFRFLYDIRGGGLFADMGTGKSKVVVDLIFNREHKQVLIVAPKKATRVWPGEFEKHGPYALDIHMLNHGKLVDRALDLSEFPNLVHPQIFVLNIETLAYKVIQDALEARKWDLIVVDEAHKLKSPGGKISRFLAGLGKKAKYRLALTGTPSGDTPLDLYGLMRFVDPGILGTSYNMFKARYAITQNCQTAAGQPYEKILGFQNQEELNQKIYQVAFRVTDEILDLPEYHHVSVPVELDDKTQKIYDEMEEESVIELSLESDLIAGNVLTRLLRLSQITSGFLPDPETDEIVELSNEKQEALIEIFEGIDSHEPIVVFALFHHDLDQIVEACDKCNRRSFELSGRQDQLDEWDYDHTGSVLVVQIQAGGAGVDLTRASKAVYFSQSYSLVNYEQSWKRLHRPGQEHPITYFHLVVPNSVDSMKYAALQNKKDATSFVVDELRRKYR